MSDITALIERLNAMAELYERDMGEDEAVLMREAAAELTRLAEWNRLRAQDIMTLGALVHDGNGVEWKARAEQAERERDEWREHHDRADHRAFAYAQEIERLREALQHAYDHRAFAHAQEIERLHEALQHAYDLMFEYGFSSDDLRPVRIALETKP